MGPHGNNIIGVIFAGRGGKDLPGRVVGRRSAKGAGVLGAQGGLDVAVGWIGGQFFGRVKEVVAGGTTMVASLQSGLNWHHCLFKLIVTDTCVTILIKSPHNSQ